MKLSSAQICEAFSGHQFDKTFDYLATEIVWNNIGDKLINGKAAIVSACNQATEYFATVITNFQHFESTSLADSVAIQSRATYIDANGEKSTVASCDIYEFSDGFIVSITSYNIELSS